MEKQKKQDKKKNSFLLVIILALVFGLAGGIVGELIAKVYIFGDIYNIPFFGEINLSDSNYNGSSLVISGAKKVVVEQDTRVTQTINNVNSSLVGVYKKVAVGTSTPELAEFNLEDYYKLNQKIGQGLIITSDGWIITNAFIENANPIKVVSDYVVITKNNEIYNIDKYIKDSITSFSFVHANSVNNLPVSVFADKKDINSGQLAVVVDWSGRSQLTSVTGFKENTILLKFSDVFSDELILADTMSKEFKGASIFNLAGNVIGFVAEGGKIIPINHFKSAINSLLEFKVIKRLGLGINYIDLSTITMEDNQYKKGALIYKNTNGVDVVKNSPADVAGLKEGDIIISIDNIEINKNNDLTDILQNYLAGDKVNIIYLRENKEVEVEIELGEVEGI
ncbi:MAG: PDZ domain-containing protein [Patescibacteria group bacterium]